MTPHDIESLFIFVKAILALNSGLVLGAVIVGVKIVRHLSQVEQRIDLMWDHFKRTVLHQGDNDE